MRTSYLVSSTLVAGFTLLTACGGSPGSGTTSQAVQLDVEIPANTFEPVAATAPQLPNNEATPARVALGKMLFFEPRLSSSWLISCNTCHNLGLAGVDLQQTSVGHGWHRGPRNAPTVLNAVYNIAQFWDGRAANLEEQAKGPVQAAVEMNNTPDRVEATLKSIPEYVDRFRAAFPNEADPVTFDNMARAIEVYEATLITPDSRFDQYLKGDLSALSASEKQGLQLFVSKGCTACHNGINVGGRAYFPFGVVNKPDAEILPRDDMGRYKVTHATTDEYVFRVAALRNVALTPPYFHSGTVWDLGEAVRVMGTAQLGSDLTDADVQAITAFLQTLNGRQPDFTYPILPPNGPETPRPMPGTVGTR